MTEEDQMEMASRALVGIGFLWMPLFLSLPVAATSTESAGDRVLGIVGMTLWAAVPFGLLLAATWWTQGSVRSQVTIASAALLIEAAGAYVLWDAIIRNRDNPGGGLVLLLLPGAQLLVAALAVGVAWATRT